VRDFTNARFLNGCDYASLPDRWFSGFARLEIREEIRPKVLKANARRLLGI
jgi:predicted TIM-barrel fold metal-dependent hydrolase